MKIRDPWSLMSYVIIAHVSRLQNFFISLIQVCKISLIKVLYYVRVMSALLENYSTIYVNV